MNPEAVVEFQNTEIKNIVGKLINLDFSRLANVLYSQHKVEEIKRLLASICIITPVGLKKYYPTYKTFNDPQLRWLFLDEEGNNVASKIYELIARDVSNYLNATLGHEFILVSYGSIAKGYTTFPISQKFPYVKAPNYYTSVPLKTSSDIDFYIIAEDPNERRSYEKYVNHVFDRLVEIRDAMPAELKFEYPMSIPYSSLEYLRVEKIPFIEL